MTNLIFLAIMFFYAGVNGVNGVNGENGGNGGNGGNGMNGVKGGYRMGDRRLLQYEEDYEFSGQDWKLNLNN